MVLAPLGAVIGAATTRRAARPGFRAPVPVICCGNVTLGGAGKTILALDLARRLSAAGRNAHVLLRGYGGSARGPHRVRPGDSHRLVGDEALLLAEAAPTWVGADRAESARAAIAAGAEALVLDDGLQNPSLEKTASLLVIDGGFGFGNHRLFPAGPLRETVAAVAARCRAAVLIGADATNAVAALPPGMAVLRARLRPGPEVAALAGRAVLAFAGIGRPEKFFAMLRDSGARIAEAVPFPDHHHFRPRETIALLSRAEALGAVPVTTAKDAARLAAEHRQKVAVATVELAWARPREIDSLILDVLRGTK